MTTDGTEAVSLLKRCHLTPFAEECWGECTALAEWEVHERGEDGHAKRDGDTYVCSAHLCAMLPLSGSNGAIVFAMKTHGVVDE